MKERLRDTDKGTKAALHREMLRLFCELGPLEHTEIARRLSVSESSVSRYYHRLLRGRIRFKPNVNRWALGLRRVVVRITFFPEFESSGKDICVGLAQLAYLDYFGRLMPENEWKLHFQVPFQHQGKLWEFLTKLEELQVLKVKDVYQTDVRVGAPFRHEYFDTQEMKFKFDWSSIKESSFVPDPSELYEQKVPFDETDLRIVEAAQSETLKITEIARQTGLGKWTTYWHWRKHIARRIIKNWYVDWLGTWILDQTDMRAMSRREFTVIDLFAKSLSSGEVKTLRQKLNSIPYLWSEMIGESDIVEELFIPNESLADAFAFFCAFDETVKSKIVLRIEDQSKAINYTVPKNLYDARIGWTFDLEDVAGRFRNLAVQLRGNRLGHSGLV